MGEMKLVRAVARPFTSARRTELIEYLSRPDVQGLQAYTFNELEGFLFSVAASPNLVPPSEWLPMVFGGAVPAFATAVEARMVTGAVMSLYNKIAGDVTQRDGILPDDIVFTDDPVDNLDDDAPVAQWSRGFIQGHYWLEEDWQEHGIGSDELAFVVWTLCFFSTPDLAKEFQREFGAPIEESAEKACTVFRFAAARYAALGARCRDAARDPIQLAASQYPANPFKPAPRTAAIGRNEPCPCDSGRKYKKCCGWIAEA